MKKITIILLLYFVLSGADAVCQTKIIAHKSYSGGLEAFDLNSSGNFGLDPSMFPEVRSFTKLSDSSVVRVQVLHDRWIDDGEGGGKLGEIIETDTLFFPQREYKNAEDFAIKEYGKGHYSFFGTKAQFHNFDSIKVKTVPQTGEDENQVFPFSPSSGGDTGGVWILLMLVSLLSASLAFFLFKQPTLAK